LTATNHPAGTIDAMTGELTHRGPDGVGALVEGRFALGHRRLAILDLSEAGQQPMFSSDGRFVLAYNGEVFNYVDLRTELSQLGYCFRSESDTEVVLYALAAWGVDALRRFNGMFALALYDRVERRVLLARDRYGVKPLYVATLPQIVLFASEVKAFLAHPAFRTRLDREALLEYFTFQNLFSHRTLFRDVQLMPPGTFDWISLDHAACLKPTAYWDFRFAEPSEPADEQERVEECRRLFRQAVRRQLVSDVEVGCYLSGGMDSGSIAAVASREVALMRSFTCGFDLHSISGLELGFDEREAAEHMSYLFQTEHYEMVLKAGDMERALPAITWHLEDPRVGQCYPNFYVAQLASKFVKVVLSGAGGDEIFGGYPWRYYRAFESEGFEDYIDRYYAFWQRLLPNTEIRRVFGPIWKDVSHVWTRDIFRSVFSEHAATLDRPEDYVQHRL